MTNNSTNWTAGTTFWKWMLTDKSKVAVFLMSFLLHASVLFNISDLTDITPGWWILIAFCFDAGTIGIFISSIIDWKNEKSKLKNG